MNKINLTPFSVEHALEYSDEAIIDGFIVGNTQFALRSISSFDLTMIRELRSQTDKNIYVNCMKLIHNHEIEALTSYLIELAAIGVDYIIFGDFAVQQIINENELKLKSIYSTETTITNQYFSSFATEIGAAGIDLAKEITFKEIKEITEHKEGIVLANIHSHIYMYQSVRKMLTNYGTIQKQNYTDDREYYLYDEERDVHYPIVENEQGTHLLASNDICMINQLEKLLSIAIDAYKIDAFGYKRDEYDAIVKLYIEAFRLYTNDQVAYKAKKRDYLTAVKELVPHKKMGTGFYFKKTIY